MSPCAYCGLEGCSTATCPRRQADQFPDTSALVVVCSCGHREAWDPRDEWTAELDDEHDHDAACDGETRVGEAEAALRDDPPRAPHQRVGGGAA